VEVGVATTVDEKVASGDAVAVVVSRVVPEVAVVADSQVVVDTDVDAEVGDPPPRVFVAVFDSEIEVEPSAAHEKLFANSLAATQSVVSPVIVSEKML